MESAAAPDYAADLLAQLTLRNQRHVHAFEELVQGYTAQLRQGQELRVQVARLEQEKAHQEQRERELLVKLSHSEEAAALGEEAAEAKEKASQLQQELTSTYKDKADISQELLVTTKELQEAKEELAVREDAQKGAEAKIRELNDRVEELSQVVDTERAAVAAVSYELDNAQANLREAIERKGELEKENERLVEQLVSEKHKVAEAFNQANELVESAQRQQQANNTFAASAELAMSGRIDPSLHGTFTSDAYSGLPTAPLHVVAAHEGECRTVCAGMTSGLIFTGGVDKHVKLWDMRSAAPKGKLTGSVSTLQYIDLSADERLLIGACSDNTIRLWNIESGRVVHTLTGHIEKVSCARISSLNSKRAVSAGADRCIKLWDLSRGYCTRTLLFASNCQALTFMPQDRMLCSAHFDGSLRFWDTSTGEIVREISNLHEQQICSVKLSPDRTQVLTCSRDHTLKLVDIQTFDVVATLAAPAFKVGTSWTSGSISLCGGFVAAGGEEGTVYVWDVKTQRLKSSLSGAHNAAIGACCWGSMGSPLVTTDKAGAMVIWQ